MMLSPNDKVLTREAKPTQGQFMGTTDSLWVEKHNGPHQIAIFVKPNLSRSTSTRSREYEHSRNHERERAPRWPALRAARATSIAMVGALV